MICCLCGQPIRPGQYLIEIRAYVARKGRMDGLELDRIVMEDDSNEKRAHYLCPAQNGAPLELVGIQR
jgi:hypothetical protein